MATRMGAERMGGHEQGSAPGGPVSPTPGAVTAHRPLGKPGAELSGGLLRDWQARNRDISLPLALRHLQTAGNLENLRLAASGDGGAYRGPVFMDSDLYKTLEAIGWELARGAPASLTDFAEEATSLLEKAQQPDGYLNSYIQVTGQQRYTRLAWSHELYCAGHLLQAAVAHARTGGVARLPGAARRFADHLAGTFLGTREGLDGHPIVESALVELYRVTGTEQYLQLARQFVEERGHGLIGDSGFGSRYLQDAVPVRESRSEAGHVVRALYLESGVVDVAAESGDAELLAASVARWDDMVANKTSLTGGNGSRHSGEAFGDAYELPPDRAYNETCAAIASFQWSWRLLLATGDSKYADLMERALYNGFGGAISADGTRFFYVNPLQRRDDHFENDDPGRRREWFSCACCPPNIMRLLASLQHYLATTAGDVLYLHQLGPASVGTDLGGGAFGIGITGDYPWSGAVELRVRRAPEHGCGLAVRVPRWSGGVSAALNGEPLAARADEHGYLLVRRRWRPGDVLAVTFDIRPQLTYPSRRIDALRGTAAVERGPLVYCFEQADQPAGVSVEDLQLRPGGLKERSRTLPEVGRTIAIECDAVQLPPVAAGEPPYSTRHDGDNGGRPAAAVAVPYFQWDNRDGRAMRVWMPLSRPDAPDTGPGQEPGRAHAPADSD
ncbi:MAG: glycoside hydrolase family 127 protein [Streptosporangiaceae bacterium]